MPTKLTVCILIHLIGVLISPSAAKTPGSVGLSKTQTTGAIIQSNSSPLSDQEKKSKEIIPASRESIVIDTFKFRIAEVTFDETAMGFVPMGMEKSDRIMFVEFDLLEGDKNAFKNLEITASGASGRKSKAFILTSGGIMQMLATVTRRNSGSAYEPGRDNITFVYAVPRVAEELHLNFPTGESIDLTPLKK